MEYMYGSGYIGGMLVHRDYRRRGIGSKLLLRALSFIKSCSSVYLFVLPENVDAMRFYARHGFKSLYVRNGYHVAPELVDGELKCSEPPPWSVFSGSPGYVERCGAAFLGYYPVTITERVYNDLASMGRVVRCGGVAGVVWKSLLVPRSEYRVRGWVLEVIPFYLTPRVSPEELACVISAARRGEDYVLIWTLEGDRLPEELNGELQRRAVLLRYDRNATSQSSLQPP